MINRRAFLRQGALTGASVGMALLGGCNLVQQRVRDVTGPGAPDWKPLPTDPDARAQALHVLNRVSFGPRPGDLARVAAMGVPAYLKEQLDDTMEEDSAVAWRVKGLDVQQMEEYSPDELRSTDDVQLLRETEQAALLRAIYSRHQLRETLADFWTNHFNIFALKKDGREMIPNDTEHVLRPYVLGKFRDMLFASARSPAMLTYLDNLLNKKGVANENYARELLELHTVGVHGGYSLKDIQEVARCFTGWTINRGPRGLRSMRELVKTLREPNKRFDPFFFDPGLHDDGPKYISFLDMKIAAGGGMKDAEQVLERLAVHPATGRYLAQKLCRHYLGSEPKAVIEKATNAFVENKSDIRALMRPILDALTSPSDNQPILKRPLDFVVSSLRALAVDTDGGDGVQKYLGDMGQPLYQWPMPDGFPEKASSWTGSLLPRWNFALALTSNTISGTNVDLTAPLTAAQATTDEARLNTLIETLLSRPHDAKEVQEVKEQVRDHVARGRRENIPDATLLSESAGLILACPVYQWK